MVILFVDPDDSTNRKVLTKANVSDMPTTVSIGSNALLGFAHIAGAYSTLCNGGHGTADLFLVTHVVTFMQKLPKEAH